jgi:hypothetical protein
LWVTVGTGTTRAESTTTVTAFDVTTALALSVTWSSKSQVPVVVYVEVAKV